MRFKLVGVKTNRDAIGARISVKAGGLTQIDEVRSGGNYLSSSDVRVHYGLGGASVIDQVEIRWPDGSVERLRALAINREYTVRQGGAG